VESFFCAAAPGIVLVPAAGPEVSPGAAITAGAQHNASISAPADMNQLELVFLIRFPPCLIVDHERGRRREVQAGTGQITTA
jgi:hypothetical protein